MMAGKRQLLVATREQGYQHHHPDWTHGAADPLILLLDDWIREVIAARTPMYRSYLLTHKTTRNEYISIRRRSTIRIIPGWCRHLSLLSFVGTFRTAVWWVNNWVRPMPVALAFTVNSWMNGLHRSKSSQNEHQRNTERRLVIILPFYDSSLPIIDGSNLTQF